MFYEALFWFLIGGKIDIDKLRNLFEKCVRFCLTSRTPYI